MCKEIASANRVQTTVTTTSLITVAISDDDILLDNASGPNLFKNLSLLRDVNPPSIVRVGGINANSTDIIAKAKGSFGPFNDVLYSPDASANVISFAYVDKHFKVRFENHDFFVDTNQGNYHFKKRGDFHVYNPKNKQNSVLYSARQLESTKEAVEIQKRLGYPGVSELHNTVKTGGISNLPITSADVLRIPKLLGSTKAESKGKMTAPGPTPNNSEWFDLKDKPQHGTLSIDVMTINSQHFLVGLIEEIT